MKIRSCSAALLTVFALSCSDTTNEITDQLNLDRPVDIAFTCFGGLRLTGGGAATTDQQIVQSAQPIASCDIRSAEHDTTAPTPVPAGQENLGATSNPGSVYYYGFILQSEPGTVAIAAWDSKPASQFSGGDVTVLDSDPLIPGKNGIAVGEDPVAIATDTEGCYVVTANAGSCDLSSVEVNAAIELATNNPDSVANGVHQNVNRIAVKNASGEPMRAKPRSMVAEPPGGTIGNVCPAAPTGIVYVTYPSCHAVAGIDLSTGTIVNNITFADDGTPTLHPDGNLSCPDECGGGVTTPGARPTSMALSIDDRVGRKVMAIGLENSNVVTYFDLDAFDAPGAPQTVVLEQNRTNDLGVTSVALSPAIGMGGDMEMINDDSAQGGESTFLYAVATDTTIRVADIENGNKECDTQVDPRFLHDVKDIHRLSCLVIGDPNTPKYRRAGAIGPGIQLVGDAVPTSIDIFRVPNNAASTLGFGAPLKLVGYFGVITASNGATYVLNVDNDDWYDTVQTDPSPPNNTVGTAIPLDIANQLRDAVPDRSAMALGSDNSTICDTNGVDPSSTDAPSQSSRYTGTITRTLDNTAISNEKVGMLPSIQQVKCAATDGTGEIKPVSVLGFAAPLTVRDQTFPDLFGLKYYDENYAFTYEGSLSLDTEGTAANGPAVRTSMMNIDADGIRLDDATHPYCDAGVEPWDKVKLRGCDSTLGDSDCATGYTCFVHPDSKIPNFGSCMLKTEADRLAVACKKFLTSVREYTVQKATTGELELRPRKHVLRTSPTDGCVDDNQCHALADYAMRTANGLNPISDTTASDTHTYSCAVDPDRAPELAADGVSPMKRCIETCSTDSDCDTGAVCDAGVCYDGVIPPQACVNAPQKYELRASEAFTVIGDHTGYRHDIIADSTGACIHDPSPSASPYNRSRIPLRAPACSPDANPFTGQLPDGTFEPNPCSLTAPQFEDASMFQSGSCTVLSSVSQERQAPSIRWRGRGMTLTMVDTVNPGDASCIGDHQGATVDNVSLAGLNIPIVPALYQFSVRIVSGFSPLLINTGAAYPVKVRRGPTQSIWVMDEGDYLSTSINIASTRGKVFRIESGALGIINVLE